MGAFTLPWEVVSLGDHISPTGISSCDPPLSPNTLEIAPGPFPALFLTHPLLNDLIEIVFVALGTGIMALLGLLAAACGANVYVAMAVPIVYTLGIYQVNDIRDPRHWWNPSEVVHGEYMLPGEEYRIGIWIARWLAWFVFLTGLSMLIAAKRELAAKPESA